MQVVPANCRLRPVSRLVTLGVVGLGWVVVRVVVVVVEVVECRSAGSAATGSLGLLEVSDEVFVVPVLRQFFLDLEEGGFRAKGIFGGVVGVTVQSDQQLGLLLLLRDRVTPSCTLDSQGLPEGVIEGFAVPSF